MNLTLFLFSITYNNNSQANFSILNWGVGLGIKLELRDTCHILLGDLDGFSKGETDSSSCAGSVPCVF